VNVLEQVGEELGVSSWIPVGQRRIDAFAALTGDYQWIHVDAERAAKGPFGTTIAHGYLTLALVASTLNEVVSNQLKAQAVLNYGIDRLRFINPVKAGSRVRNRVRLAGAVPKGGGRTLITMACTLKAATSQDGSWWGHWLEWLQQHSGDQIIAPQVGSATRPPIADAPGTYALEK
jgi:acyl dehydratase